MKVLVATRRTQGRRRNDFCYVEEGELVDFGTECSRERVDGRCGCRRALCGVLSAGATTTCRVEDRDMTPEALRASIDDSLRTGGWHGLMSADERARYVERQTIALLRLAALFPVGCVLERRGDRMRARPSATEAPAPLGG